MQPAVRSRSRVQHTYLDSGGWGAIADHGAHPISLFLLSGTHQHAFHCLLCHHQKSDGTCFCPQVLALCIPRVVRTESKTEMDTTKEGRK